MKKLIAIVLVALMAVPFAVLSSAAIVPAEPTLSNTEVNIYVSDGTTSGVQAAETNPGTKESPNNRFNKACEFVKTTGGSYIIPGKGYVPKTYGDTSFPATTSPVRITAVDPVTNTRYNPDKIVDSADKTNGQKGMFMIQNSADASNVAKFFGEYIFDNISILDRSSATTQPATLSVEDGGKIVVKNTVDVIKALEAGKTSILNVNAGGYAYLHAAGFSDYTGNGTIVLDPALVSSGAVTKAAFANFTGSVVYQDGSDPFATTGGDTTETPNNPSTGDMTVVVAAIAAFSVVSAGAVLTLKKRAN